MSLSFVSSAILSSSDGISHNEEKSIESKEVSALRLSQSRADKPLFEQLRANRDQEKEKYDEQTKLMRMGMRPLDEEDCAHLDAVEAMREEKQRVTREREEKEIELFRVARAERSLSSAVVEEQEQRRQSPPPPINETPQIPENKVAASKPIEKPVVVPVIVGKRKRRQAVHCTDSTKEEIARGDTKKPKSPADSENNNKLSEQEENASKSDTKKTESDSSQGEEGGLGALLGGYGSDSDDD